ncbi:50S ribosomal protein L4 [Patescibacteria group bacterium]
MKVSVKDQKGKKIEEITLKKEVFGVEMNQALLTQYIRVFLANQRQGTSSAKTRAEISGGGKKPWKQKGTGRARAGSSRSPLWRHGGITHGPKPKSWRLEMPKKMKKLVMKVALSQKAKEKEITVLDKLTFKKPSTKDMAAMFKKLKLEGKSILVVKEKNESVAKSARNIPEVTTALVSNVNAFEIIKNKNVIFTKNALKDLEKKLCS